MTLAIRKSCSNQAVRAGLKVEDWRDRLSCGKKNMTGGSEVGVAEFSGHLAGSQARTDFYRAGLSSGKRLLLQHMPTFLSCRPTVKILAWSWWMPWRMACR
jgi:hypothetical protein